MSIILRGSLKGNIEIVASSRHFKIVYHDANYILYGVLPKKIPPSEHNHIHST